MDANNCSSEPTMPHRYGVFAVVYSMVLMVGLPLNALSLWILLKKHGLKSSNVVITASLAVSDILLTLSLPLRIYYYATVYWPFGPVMCTIVAMLFRINMQSSSTFITFLSVDRLMAVVYPLRSRGLRRPMVSLAVCVCTWIVITALCTPNALSYIKRLRETGSDCFVIGDDDNLQYFKFVVLTVLFPLLILLVVNVVSTVLVFRTLYRRHVDLADKNLRGIMMIFVMNLLMFLIFFLPYAVMVVLAHLKIVVVEMVEVAMCHAIINCCLDPIVYYYSLSALGKRTAESKP